MDMRKDILLALLGTILGCFLGVFITKEALTSYDWLIAIILFLGIVLTLALIGPLGLIMRTPGQFRINGSWESTWSYVKQDQKVKVTDELVLRQYGRYLIGRGESTRVDGPFPFKKAKYRLKGRVLPTGVVEGKWWTTENGKGYRGSFLGRIKISSNEVTAKWLGLDAEHIHTGDWFWTKTG